MLALGPYAFMDIFDPIHVCNHTDQEGRYAYKVTFIKPSLRLCHFNTVIVLAPARNDVSVLSNASALHAHCINSLYLLKALLTALTPLVGAEAGLGTEPFPKVGRRMLRRKK
jgi:hypothetical protein